MNHKLKLTYLIFILSLNFSCIESSSTEREINSSVLKVTAKTDTLKFKSEIRAIFQDSKGNYWFGSGKEGVSRYDGSSFKYFTINDGLADNQVRSIQEDQIGNIWFGTANGVSSYNGRTIETHTLIENLESEWMKKDSDLWFNAGVKQGVYRHDGQKLTYLPFPKSKNITSGSLYAITSISKGKNNMFWFGTYAGVFGYNGSEFTIIDDETLRLTKDSESIHVRSIFEDSQGKLWIGNNGIGVICKSEDSIINFSKKHGRLIPMNEFEANILGKQLTKNTGLQAVFAIEEDSKGNIWFGDRDSGAWKYDGMTLTNFTVDKSLKSQMILSIYEDKDNNLFFGMSDGSIYIFNGKTFKKWH